MIIYLPSQSKVNHDAVNLNEFSREDFLTEVLMLSLDP